MNLKQTKDFFSNDKYATEVTGIEIESIDTNYAKCRLKIQPKHLNAGNSVMGGAIYTLADFTFAVSSNTEKTLCVTLTSNISYLNACKGDTLYAETTCEKSGKSTCMFTINITDNLGTKVAVVNTTGYKIGK